MKKMMKNDEKFFRVLDSIAFSNLFSSFLDYDKKRDFYSWIAGLVFAIVLFVVILLVTL